MLALLTLGGMAWAQVLDGKGRGTLSGATLADLQKAYVEQGFGMFLHYSMGTYTGEEWASPNRPIDTFAPTALDTDQWAAAAKAAGMKYGVLTAKHHDGFALWDTAQSDYDVAGTSWFAAQPPGQGDIVKRYADSFRAQGLNVGIYYSIWDRSNGIDGSVLTSRQATDYVKAELTELLTNYGPIHAIWTDGWGWKGWYGYVLYQEVYDHIKALSPTTLLVENNHSATNTDIRTYEQTPLPPAGNTFPAELSATIRLDNKWFWSFGADVTKDIVVLAEQRATANARNAAYLLDVTPDLRGLIPDSQLAVLSDLPDAARLTNLARTGVASQSSTWNQGSLNLTADQAVDGIFAPMNMAHTANGDFAPWWALDLGGRKAITRIVIHNRAEFAGRLRDITVMVLNEQGQAVFTSALLNPGNSLGGGIGRYDGNTPATLHVNFAPVVRGRYVRIIRAAEGTTTENEYVLTLPEVQVFGLAAELSISGFRYEATSAWVELTFVGEAEAVYRVVACADAGFGEAARIVSMEQGDGEPEPGHVSDDGLTVTTDAEGRATVRIAPGPAEREFLRVERAVVPGNNGTF